MADALISEVGATLDHFRNLVTNINDSNHCDQNNQSYS
jgi:hypothetical protein